MANKLPDGKKLVVELTNEGFRGAFYKNKWGEFLNAVQKTGIGRSVKFPEGVVAFLVDEGSVVGDYISTIRDNANSPERLLPVPTPVTQADIDRARELAETPDVPDTEGLPPFEPFGFDETVGLKPTDD